MDNSFNREYYQAKNHQYLLIHKSGSSSIREAFDFEHEATPLPVPGKIVWTVIRDPVERFYSGLQYDSMQVGVLGSPNWERIFTEVPLEQRGGGKIPHTIPQSLYVLHQPVNVFVHLKDLDAFLRIHGALGVHKNVSAGTPPRLHEETVKALHAFDNYYFSKIKFWRWEYGAIF